MTPAGVRASVHSTKTRADPCCTWPRVSPTSLVPRSSSTTSVDTEGIGRHDAGGHAGQRRIDGRLQRAIDKAPFGSNSRWVGNTCARTACVTLGRSNALSSPGSCDAVDADVSDEAGVAAGGGRRHRQELCENTAPDSWRSSASCAGVLTGGGTIRGGWRGRPSGISAKRRWPTRSALAERGSGGALVPITGGSILPETRQRLSRPGPFGRGRSGHFRGA